MVKMKEQEMLKTLDQYNFPVRKVQLADPETGQLVDRWGVKRTDTGQILSTVGSRYELITHQQVISKFLEQVGAENIEIRSRWAVGNGVRAYLEFMVKDREYSIGAKPLKDGTPDVVKPMFVLMNSYDESTRFGFIAGIWRLICSNGAYVGIRALHVVRKHVGEFDADFVQSMAETIKQLEERVIPRYGVMVQTKFSQDDLSRLQRYVAPRLVKSVSEEPEKELVGRSQWEVYNTFTRHLTHDYKGSYERQIQLNSALTNAFELRA